VFNEDGVTFLYKDYRADRRAQYKRMTLATHEFIRRFLESPLREPGQLGETAKSRLSSV
jgi:hypothetical protein